MQENLTALVESAGIVGAGGAGFPTHVKLTPKNEDAIDYIQSGYRDHQRG